MYFTATSTEFEIVANGAAATIDDIYIYQIGAVAEYDGSGVGNSRWDDKSGNDLHGTVSGATVENAPADADSGLTYEEGTWTPALNRVGAFTVSYTQQLGYYTKIGRKVSVDGRIVINAVAAQGSSVNYISGLPFVLGGTAGIRFSGGVGLNNGFATVVANATMGTGGESNITFRDDTNTNSNLVADWVAGGIIAFSLEYFIN